MVEMMSGVCLLQCCAVYHLLSFISSLSKVSHSGADVQVVFCHCYPVVFHLFVEQLTIFYISGLVLYPAVVFYRPSPTLRYRDGTTVDREIFALKIIRVKIFRVDKFSRFRSIREIFITVEDC